MKTQKSKQIKITQFLITGTDSIVAANRAVQRYFRAKHLGKKQVRYHINGITATLKLRHFKQHVLVAS